MKDKKILTAYYPWLNDNLYIVNVRNAISDAGYEIRSFRSIFKNPIKFLQCKIVNLNWFENAPTRKSYWKKNIVLEILKIFRKKIVYTIHNKQPHDLKYNKYALKLMQKLCNRSAAIIGLCPDTHEVVRKLAPAADEKVVVIPHPNYIANYSASATKDLRGQFGFSKGDLVLLYMGLLRPYKNLELLIDIFHRVQNDKIKLLIAGEPFDAAYQEELVRHAAGNPDIAFDFRYIPDEEVAAYYHTADLVVLPYHKVSSLNSGVVYLSFSLKRTVICPDIGTINMISDKSFVYSYHYDTDEEHAGALDKILAEAISDFEANPDILREKGEMAYRYVKGAHSPEGVRQKYAELYAAILNPRAKD